jgi:uncharacterized membrane protein YphA (DoxX/SURF4 family)
MLLNLAFWPSVFFLAFLCTSIFLSVREVASGPEKLHFAEDRILALGPAFAGAALAAFGAEHFAIASVIAQGVPSWIPGHLFWAYFVGVALIAAGLSMVAGRCLRWSAAGTGLMLMIFVLTISVPRILSDPRNPIIWTVMLRDLSFSLGAWALWASFALHKEGEPSRLASGVIMVARVTIGAVLVFFGARYLVNPAIAGGVPLEKMTPGWVPVAPLWGYLCGAVLVIGGILLILNRKAKTAALWTGVLMVAVTVFLYTPIWIMNPPDLKMEGLNYVADTLYYGATLWLLAKATSMQSRLSCDRIAAPVVAISS